MFQSFEATTKPETAKPRIAALRKQMKTQGIDAFLVPRADRHQGEYVAACDERLAYITSFSGSAGHAAITTNRAVFFTDGRYTLQSAVQVDNAIFDFKSVPQDSLADWLNAALPSTGVIGFDPWVHTKHEIETLGKALNDGLELRQVDNPIHAIWDDRPSPPSEPAFAHPIEFSGLSSGDKRAQIANALTEQNAKASVITMCDSICWLLNMRGADIPRMPAVQAFAIIDDAGKVHLFLDPAKVATLGLDPDINVKNWDQFETTLKQLTGPVIVDQNTAPFAVSDILKTADIAVINAPDPCALPKACKNETELAGAHAAHLRDGAAMCNFLSYVNSLTADADVTEIDLVKKLESFRRDTGKLKDISFETICGSGPNGAFMHYRVTEASNRSINIGDVLLVDSGGQYQDGTTDITRTMAIGPANPQAVRAFTLVLKGMIAISRLRFPRGLAGRDIDPIARHALWQAGLDFDHGTGHGVGSYLSVHEGPQGISRKALVPLKEGMIVSNEPGYYQEGAFGIRIENLLYVKAAGKLAGADDRDMLEFETLAYVPLDKNMINKELLSPSEINWLNTYHTQVFEKLSGLVNPDVQAWLTQACAPL